MATFNGRLMAAGRQAVTGGLAFKKQTLSTQVYVDTTGSANDLYYFAKLPKGAVICGGRVYSGRLASGASISSVCLELCLGLDQIVANASGSTFSVASLTSGLGHFGPISYATMQTSNSSLPTMGSSNLYDSGFTSPLGGLLLSQGPLTVTVDNTAVFATLVVAAGSGSGISGYLNLELDYITSTYS